MRRATDSVLVLVIGLALALAASARLAALEPPVLERRVTDRAEIVPGEAERRLETRLTTLEETSGAQLAVLTLPGLEGESVESFSLRVARSWGLGRAGADDGVLLLVAMAERVARIEVGTGLEERLTEREADRILREVMVPYFRAGRHGEGIEAVVEAVIMEITDGSATAEALPATAGESRVAPPPPPSGLGRLRGFRLPGPRPLWLGGVVAASAVVATLLSVGPSAAFLVLLLAPETGWAWVVAIAAGIALANLTRGFGRGSFRPGRWRRGGGGWSSSGGGSSWSGGGSSGGGSSGGGFGGGGGSFGGGGASSRW